MAILSIVSLTIIAGYIGGRVDREVKDCTKVMAYIPVKNKWITKEVCLEGEK